MSGDNEVSIHLGIKIPLRDGVHLAGTLYMPLGTQGRKPCVVSLTPYLTDTYHERGIYFASHGIPFVLVDVRGRGSSEGVFSPMMQEAYDGYDVIVWLSKQPYCDGRLAMWGGSYAGYNQWAAAKEIPPGLASIVPAAAPFMGVDFPMRNNIFYPYVVQWLAYTSGHGLQSNLFSDKSYWSSIFKRWYESGKSFNNLSELVHLPEEPLQEWLRHPELSDFWDTYNPTKEQYAHIEIPILTITGAYDDDQPGALEHYQQHMRYGTERARAVHYVVIGPWDHAGTRTPLPSVGGVPLGPKSLIDLNRLHLEWYRWAFHLGERPGFLNRRVAYYVTGREEWRYADSLEAITERHDEYFLDSAGNASSVFSAGHLGASPGSGSPDCYTFDPTTLKGPEIDAEAAGSGTSLTEQAVTIALSGRLLVYQTEPLEQDLEVSGFFRLSTWLSINCPDTDLYVSVHEVDVEGRSIRLSTDALRARYRESLRVPRLLVSDAPYCYEFSRFTFVSRHIKRGHRLRMVIAPIGRLIEGIFAQKNYNGGGIVSQESANDGRPVTVRLLHAGNHQSILYVPIGRLTNTDRNAQVLHETLPGQL